MITKQDLVFLLTMELQTTSKVVAAVPEGHMNYKPNEIKSPSLDAVLKNLIAEHGMYSKFLKGETVQNPMADVPEFTTVAEASKIYDEKMHAFMAELEAAADDDLLQPFSMWGMNGSRADIILGLMRDMIHHRGQLTVYIRLLDGKVPSVYGPTYDEPMQVA